MDGELTFLTAAAPAANPHQGIQECVSLVASLHGQIDAVLVAGRVDSISRSRVVDFVQDILGPSEPSLGLDHDVCRRLVCGLQHVVGAQVGGRVLGHDLGILSARLSGVRSRRKQLSGELTDHDGTLAPATSPLATHIRNPFPVAPNALTHRCLGAHLDAHSEVEFEGRGGNLQ